MNEANVLRRHSLERLMLAINAELNPLRVRRWEQIHEEAEGLEFPSYRALCDDLRQLQLDALAEQMTSLLGATTDKYQLELDVFAHNIGLTPAEATPADLAYLIRGRRFDAYFPRSELTRTFARTMRGMGIDVEWQRGLKVDVEERPLKSPRAFCAAVRIPDDVRLVVAPKGGLDDYRAFFHEAGHAEHFVSIRADLPFVYRALGDSSLTEAYAFLLEGLTRDPRWIRRMLSDVPPDEYFRHVAFARLRLIRRYAAKLHYELELHGRAAPLRDLPDRYVEHLRRALVHRIHEVDYLADVDDGFYVAQYLRAWMFEVQIRRFLMREFGEDWTADHRVGDFLMYLWERGQKVPIEQIAREMGYDGLDSLPLLQDLLA